MTTAQSSAPGLPAGRTQAAIAGGALLAVVAHFLWRWLDSTARPGSVRPADVPLLEPYSEFEARRRQLDLRFAKNIRLGSARLNASIGLYNVFNAASVIRAIENYGTDWQKPTAVLSARMLQFQGSLNF